jgi:hypothetical protein
MARRVFKCDLSQKGIDKLIKDLKNYRNVTLQDKIRQISQQLAMEGVSVAKIQVQKYNAVFTGELVNSIFEKIGMQTKTRSVFYVVANSEHAVFVEFGTGQMGEEAAYPYPLPPGFDWKYNVGQKIFEVSPGQYGWFYHRDGQTYFTQGMPARPFMYETAMDLYTKVVAVVMKVFSS